MKPEKEFAVIGYGRFGKLWAQILSEHGTVFVYESRKDGDLSAKAGLVFSDLETALKKSVIFLCIPISEMESFLRTHAAVFAPGSTVIDTASVKSYPIAWMDALIPDVPHMGLHPLFGPDSYRADHVNLMIITPSEQYPQLAPHWSEVFASWRFFTQTIPAEEHDRSIAYSQGVTHFVGNVLREMHLRKTNTPTHGFTLLQDVARFCSNDTPQLFRDMLLYNPHSERMFGDFMRASHQVSTYIRRENNLMAGPFVLGVMGEEGSFSQEAGEQWLQDNQIKDARILCLSNAEKVYQALDFGSIQVGLLPIQNAAGGMVIETVRGLAQHNCKITGFFPFLVRQCLMCKQQTDVESPRSIHSHPQALRQCKRYLQKHHASVPLIEEEDTAGSARRLAHGELPKNAWVIAPEKCVRLYDLKLLRRGIQDLSYNITDFVTVIRE
ncbi:MAG: prephenate dehydrogenase/arogenate dehydrogenase family protein [Candidatus Neomarinimicrobiota bacterium]|jgi:prephenate dehydrogenase|nr:prephenate dehydrogenase/arogenate dehydrogenase family protein [Candidatus Neomarinimicrobiota bacterium]MDD3966204.1 prephenate dehydrogenase/arogenate dehydrogenase family protein [Candidatus Neomarinimicrobiota bacterium]MDX9779766.1 prephenate dehydrogenase/arogenate dehydrogenase family protein [bacterium]